MNWIDLKKDKAKPNNNRWIIIQSSLKNVPKFETCFYSNGEWYLPENDDSCSETVIKKWCYIEE